jgi:hypothetical protein
LVLGKSGWPHEFPPNYPYPGNLLGPDLTPPDFYLTIPLEGVLYKITIGPSGTNGSSKYLTDLVKDDPVSELKINLRGLLDLVLAMVVRTKPAAITQSSRKKAKT